MKPIAFAHLLTALSIFSSFGQMLPNSMVGDFTNERSNFRLYAPFRSRGRKGFDFNHTGQADCRLERRAVNGETLYVCEGDFPKLCRKKTMAFSLTLRAALSPSAGFGNSLEQALDNQRKMK